MIKQESKTDTSMTQSEWIAKLMKVYDVPIDLTRYDSIDTQDTRQGGTTFDKVR